MSGEHTHAKPKGRKAIWILSFLLVAAVSASGFWYWQYHQSIAKSPQAEQKRWKSELDRIAITPNEEPVITSVLDKSKLTNATLRAQAHNGDRIYIYTKAKRIILFRPSDEKIVNMLTIQTQNQADAGNQQKQTATNATQTQP